MSFASELRRHARQSGLRVQRLNHWLTAKTVGGLFAILQLLPVDRALDVADRIARQVGPWTSRHRVAMDNLRLAYPEKTEAECDEIAVAMWGQMARLAVEYVFLDQLFDFDPTWQEHGRVEVQGKDVFEDMVARNRPKIFFTAHTGNFEMFPIAAAALGIEIASLFRAPNNRYIAEQVSRKRRISGNRMVPSKAGAAFVLARVLENGGNIGALVDQKFMHGVPTTFFGRACETSPLLSRLARQYEADIYPARCVRLPGNRYRLELLERLEPPRDAEGKIDVNALCQTMNDVVEGWVREHPAQWMWFHRRWQVYGPRPRRS